VIRPHGKALGPSDDFVIKIRAFWAELEALKLALQASFGARIERASRTGLVATRKLPSQNINETAKGDAFPH
jgi:hypothetical protein